MPCVSNRDLRNCQRILDYLDSKRQQNFRFVSKKQLATNPTHGEQSAQANLFIRSISLGKYRFDLTKFNKNRAPVDLAE